MASKWLSAGIAATVLAAASPSLAQQPARAAAPAGIDKMCDTNGPIKATGSDWSTFGVDAVFKDDSDLEAGDQWPDRLDEALRSCRVLLAGLGPLLSQSRRQRIRRKPP